MSIGPYRLMSADGEWHLLRKPNRATAFAPIAHCGASMGSGEVRWIDFAQGDSIPRPLCRPCLASHEREIDESLAANPALARFTRGANPRLTRFG